MNGAGVCQHLPPISLNLRVQLGLVVPTVRLVVNDRDTLTVLKQQIDKPFEDAVAIRYSDIDLAPVPTLRRALDDIGFQR